MSLSKNQSVAIIGVPMDLGADRRGVDMGPSAIRYAGLESRLEQLGWKVSDIGDLIVKRSKHAASPYANLKYLQEIARVNQELRDTVANVMHSGHFPLILGGDHSIAIGSLAGVGRHVKRVGVIWFDAHGDVNTPDTSPSGNIHGMPLAAALGYGHPALTSIAGASSAVQPEHTVLIGTRSLDDGEKVFLKHVGITVFTMHELDRLGMSRVMEMAIDIASNDTDGVHLSLDLDGLDPNNAPGVGTPVPGGITFRESHLALELLSSAGCVVSAEFVEVNPLLDHRNQTADTAVALIGSLLGDKIM